MAWSRFRVPARVLLAALAAVLVPRAARAVGQHDLAVLRLRVPDRVRLTDAHPAAGRRARITMQNRGTEAVVFADAATLAATVQLAASAAAGPVVCPTLAPLPEVRRPRQFPLVLAPGAALRIVLDVRLVCSPDPAGGAFTWTAHVEHAAVDGAADEHPTDDDCPRPALGADTGCGRRRGAVGPVTTRVLDGRATTRFALPGPFAVGETELTLVDATRPTPPNGSFPGASARTLPTVVWYPAPAGAGGLDAALASDGAPYPLVLFSHGLTLEPRQSTSLTTHLASHGYVVVAPRFPLSWTGAPGGPTVIDEPGQARDLAFLIDAFLGFAATPGNRFAGGLDGTRIAATGHSAGGLTTLLATYDAVLRDPRIRAAMPLAPLACWFGPGWFGAVDVPLLLVHGDADLLLTLEPHARDVYARANAPKQLAVLTGGNHFGFTDAGATIDDLDGCAAFPPLGTLAGQVVPLLAALGGDAASVSFVTCGGWSFCTGDPAHVDGRRQQQVTKQLAAAFFASVLRGDALGERYLADELATTSPDVTTESVP